MNGCGSSGVAGGDLDGVLAAHARTLPRAGERGHDRGEEAEPVGRRPGQRVDGVLRVRHQADHVALGVADARDVAGGAVGRAVGVPDDHPAGALELVQRRLVGDEGALAVLDRHGEQLTGGVARRPARCRVRSPSSRDVACDEPQARVPGERAGQQVRLAQDLEAVADAEHRQARRPRPGSARPSPARTGRSRRSAGSRRRRNRRAGSPRRRRAGRGRRARAGPAPLPRTARRGPHRCRRVIRET